MFYKALPSTSRCTYVTERTGQSVRAVAAVAAVGQVLAGALVQARVAVALEEPVLTVRTAELGRTAAGERAHAVVARAAVQARPVRVHEYSTRPARVRKHSTRPVRVREHSTRHARVHQNSV